MPPLLEAVYRLQAQFNDLPDRERLLLKMFANLLERHYGAAEPRNRLNIEEYEQVPGRWELSDGMLEDY